MFAAIRRPEYSADGRQIKRFMDRRSKAIAVTGLLLSNGADVNATDHGGQTALHIAIANTTRGSRDELVQCLLSAGATVDAVYDREGTPLKVACRLSMFSVAKLLISHRADINAPAGPGHGTPLYEAEAALANRLQPPGCEHILKLLRSKDAVALPPAGLDREAEAGDEDGEMT